MGKFTLGLEKIEFGDIETDGGVATDWEIKGLTYKDSCTIEEADPTVQEFMSEENDTPEVISVTDGIKSIKFQLMNPDADTRAYFMGGTVVTGPPKKWAAPSSKPTIEKSMKITPKNGSVLIIPRGSIRAKEVGGFAKSNLQMIEVTVTVMIPTKAAESPLYRVDG